VCKTVVPVMSLAQTTNVLHVMVHALKVGRRPVLESMVINESCVKHLLLNNYLQQLQFTKWHILVRERSALADPYCQLTWNSVCLCVRNFEVKYLENQRS